MHRPANGEALDDSVWFSGGIGQAEAGVGADALNDDVPQIERVEVRRRSPARS